MTSLSFTNLHRLAPLLPEMSLLLLIVGAFAAHLAPRPLDAKRFVYGALLGCAAVLILLAFVGSQKGSLLNGAFRLYPFALFLKIVFLASVSGVLLITREYLKTLAGRANDFVLLLLAALLGSFFLASAQDFVTLFITVEWITIALYTLTSFLKTDVYSLESGVKYLVMGAFSSALFLFGISLIYAGTGSIDFNAIRIHLTADSAAQASGLTLLGFLLLLSGLGFKTAVFPFQFWAPDVYEGAPTPVTAFLSVFSKAAGFAALMLVLFAAGLGESKSNWQLLLACSAAATLFYGNLGALRQTGMKRLFAYSSIGHAGYVLLGLVPGTVFGLQASLFYLISYALSNLAAFFAIVIAERELGGDEINRFEGLAQKAPVLAASFFTALLSLGGIPPLVGFFGKFLVLQAAVEGGFLWLALVGAINVIVSLYYYLAVINKMYAKRGLRGKKVRVSAHANLDLVLLAVLLVAFGIFQRPLFQLAEAASQNLF